VGYVPPLTGAVDWLNSPPLTREGLKGKVVLVQFWTYSCINCLRALPAIQAWAQAYRSAGLVVVGVHAPEFAFEKREANVRKALEQLGVRHAVAQDNDFAIWRRFGNDAWPALYLFDADGRLRHRHAGEGRYRETEATLRALLQDAGQVSIPQAMAVPVAEGVKAPASPVPWQSPETYLGHAKAGSFAGGTLQRDRFMTYAPPRRLAMDTWALAGGWTVRAEHADADAAGARLALRYAARDVHMVLGLRDGSRPVRIRVLLDGQPPGADHGTDVDAQGWGVVDGHRLYQLVRAREGVRERTVEVQFLQEGAQAYAVTFG
jgi:thiol-disulfide isomerase/thioredoxin